MVDVFVSNLPTDRYVIVGNHRDAWVFGAVDPSSGTASMIELSRVLMQLHNTTGTNTILQVGSYITLQVGGYTTLQVGGYTTLYTGRKLHNTTHIKRLHNSTVW